MQHFKLTLTLQSLFLSTFLFLFLNPSNLLAEGTKSIAPSTADEAALFVGAGNTGTRGGDYGLFAWKDSDSKLYFNVQNSCEKVYMGFSIPKNDRSFSYINPVYGGSGIEENLIFRVVDPLGNPINNLSCFGNTTINGEVWQTLNSNTANISSRAAADNGPNQLGNTAGYNGFELDLSACGLNLTGNYSIEFYTTNASYNPNTARSGFYIPYFDITVADCTNQGMTGRVWSNNWGIGIKRDGSGSFDRAFNGSLFVCSSEGFITKIDFNTNTNTRASAGNSDQRSGFRAGSFNISFNRQGPGTSGDIITDRQSVPNVNSPNPLLPVFLNLPDEAFCPVQEIGKIKAAANFVTGCPQNRCINVATTQPGQFEIIIEGANGNGILDQPSERRVIYQITDADKVTNPETVGFIYEACIPWDGKDGNGNILLEVAITVTGSYFQGIYHFPVYDAEFNDDGFIVETVRPALGRQLLYYDDTNITEISGSTESKDGTNGCTGPCHRWTGEWGNYADKDDNYGNYNTINTWWFASTTAQDFTSNVGQLSPLAITCPANFIGCTNQSIDPSITGQATTVPDNLDCAFVLDYTDAVVTNNCTEKIIERTWFAYLQDLPNERKTCTQTITLKAPILTNCPTDVVLGCADGNTYAWNPPTISGLCGGTIQQTSGPVSGSAFPAGTTTIIYEIVGGCGTTQTCSFTVTVIDSGSSADLMLTCPSDFSGCAGQPTTPNITGTAAVSVTNSNCPTTFSYTDVVTDNGCGAKTIKREWFVYFTNKPTERKTCTQTITLTEPTLSNCPTDVVLDCVNGNRYSWNAPTVNGTCGGTLIQTSGLASGSAFPVGTTTITYQIGSGCANQTCSFTVTVKDAGDLDDLSIICPSVPADATDDDCTGQSSDPSVTGTPTVVNNSSCPTTLDYTDNVTDDGCGAKTIKREWVVYFTNNPSIRKTCSQLIILTAPTLSNCPTDVVLNCGNGNTYSWNPPTVLGGCAGDVRQISGLASGSTFPIGTTTVTYEVGGGCTNQTCSFTVTVKDAGNLDDLTITCPELPADVADCTGQSSDPSVTGKPTVSNNSNCPTTLEYTDNVTDDGCGAKTIKREWVVYFTNNPSIRKTCSQLIIINAPSLSNCPTDVVLDCGAGNIYNWNLPTVNGACSGTLRRTSGPASGSIFPVGTTTITYEVGGGCANQTCSFTVTVKDAGNLDDLYITCPSVPADVVDCTGQSSDPSVTGTPTVVNNSSCPTTLEYTDNVTDNGCGEKTIKREWVVYFTNNPSIRKTCSQLIIITAPTLSNCPTDVVLGCENGNTYAWNAPTVLGGCAGTVIQTSGPVSGSSFPVGTTTITYQIGAGCANQTCSFTVTVIGAGDPNDLIITCPDDVTNCAGQSTNPSITGVAKVTIATADVADSNCPTTLIYNDVVTDSGCGAKTIQREWAVYYTNKPTERKTCTQTITLTAPTLSNCPMDVVLGCEDGNTYSWTAPTANGACGGTVIQTSGPTSGSSFPIGTTTITYQIGTGCTNQTCSFTITVVEGGGLTTNCPSDVVLDCETGQNGATYAWETPTASSCCNSCPEPGLDLTDFVYMGTLNGHQYYCSKEKADWATAKVMTESQGGYLAVINSAEENQMLSTFLDNQSAYIGLNDLQQEGVYQWLNNDPLTYTNWYPGQPNNYGNSQDYTRLLPNGQWDDIAGHYKLEYILEIPCLTIQQCAGPVSGSVFPVGTTEVAYHIEDNCGNEEVCTFNVTVNPCEDLMDYCDITGQNTSYFWIRHVVFGTIDNPTGANGGYGDFSNLSTNIPAGSEQTIILSPGYARNKYYVNWRVWIDYNRDGDFNDANEKLFTVRDYNILKIKFRIPQQCAIGQTKMRVSMKYGNPANSCEDFTYGEVEDYTINLTPPTLGLRAITATSRLTNEIDVEVIPHESTAPLKNLLPTEMPSLTVFPNPVATNLQVQLSDYQQLDGVVKIYNHLGQVVHQELLSKDNDQQLSIAVNHLPDGMYLLSIESDDMEPIVQKFNKH